MYKYKPSSDDVQRMRTVTTCIFRSPEHEVYGELLWSVFVRRLSSVRCQLFALNNFSSKTVWWILK